MGLFRNLTKTIGKLAPIAIPAMIGFGVGGGSMGGIGSFFSGMSGMQKLGLGVGALGLAGALGERREYTADPRPEPVGKDFAITSRMQDGRIVQLNDPQDLADYRREIQGGIATMMHGGEVHGPGTGTSDSVPARLSDGEFVMTAAAVRGAGGGDRDIGAARMYDMMAELEAQG